MKKLTSFTSYADAQAQWHPNKLWDLFDGAPSAFNIAHECIDRHATDDERVAIIVVQADGHVESLTYRDISFDASRFANCLVDQCVNPVGRFAVMLEPSRSFYAALFGIIKTGAIAVPLFSLLGPDGIRLRVEDCAPRILLTNAEQAELTQDIAGLQTVVVDTPFLENLKRYAAEFTPSTAANDLAIFQYTSGTTRELPDAIRHTHKALVTLMVAALYG